MLKHENLLYKLVVVGQPIKKQVELLTFCLSYYFMLQLSNKLEERQV